mmetsp:Transcript_12225/g.42623  ORF Transcript_12225/g.42623 Transcript_12225/m.42623 type:complete len:222 (-) Transcript_12225:715-1380(-)
MQGDSGGVRAQHTREASGPVDEQDQRRSGFPLRLRLPVRGLAGDAQPVEQSGRTSGLREHRQDALLRLAAPAKPQPLRQPRRPQGCGASCGRAGEQSVAVGAAISWERAGGDRLHQPEREPEQVQRDAAGAGGEQHRGRRNADADAEAGREQLAEEPRPELQPDRRLRGGGCVEDAAVERELDLAEPGEEFDRGPRRRRDRAGAGEERRAAAAVAQVQHVP